MKKRPHSLEATRRHLRYQFKIIGAAVIETFKINEIVDWLARHLTDFTTKARRTTKK